MDPQFIIESFWQKKSNCACVAFIKALLLEQRTARSFRIQRVGLHRLITFRDQRAILLTEKEIGTINAQNAFSFRRPRDPERYNHIQQVKRFAELCFAVMVRNMQLSGYDGKAYTQQDAIRALTEEGIQTDHFHKLLGIKRGRAVPLTPRRLARLRSRESALIYNEKHITIGSCGYYEVFGKAVPMGEEIPLLLGEKATHWYRLKGGS